MAIFWAIMTMLLISQLHKFNSYSVSAIYALLEDEEKKRKSLEKKTNRDLSNVKKDSRDDL